ncbi:MAG: YegS/Rv2252/BmrU family lipid kinase [Okeania sp. SIO2F4]|uniref:YegS/Rv2252/BmrU family lipid kinase n=1 Tax=Okeania sp. SIO2F4 TaxID=2607790 RepID=UPI00142C91F9|nr:YegS/Rv2252/BmrU family lipid kinase [Okeania sp. SIO2F4]NES02190.1 YegS/Rv2252/BmrU family lipid kinase [Okeania sp. SIO2F4]
MTRSACLIFNPVAGQNDAEIDLQNIDVLLSPEFDLDLKLTTPEVNAGQLAQAAVEKGVECIIVSGGDGTVSAAASAVIGTDIPLGIIPRGTANALSLALEIPTTIEAACFTILEGKTHSIDTALCHQKPMVLLSGIGWEAETVDSTSREAKDQLGSLAYFIYGVRKLWEFNTFEVKIETDNDKFTTNVAAITVANAAPPTSLLAQGPAGIVYDDGLLDVTIVAPKTRRGAISASYHLLKTSFEGSPVERDDLHYFQTKYLKISTYPVQKVVLDGEIIGNTPVEINCIPNSLKVFVPIKSQ